MMYLILKTQRCLPWTLVLNLIADLYSFLYWSLYHYRARNSKFESGVLLIFTFGIGSGGVRCMPLISTTSGVSGRAGLVMKCVLDRITDGLPGPRRRTVAGCPSGADAQHTIWVSYSTPSASRWRNARWTF